MNRPEQSIRPELPARFTAAEFLRMAELGAFDGMKVELDHGELVRMNPPFVAHSVAQGQVIARISEALPRTGVTLLGEVTILLGAETVRAFDAALVRDAALEEKVLRPEHVVLAIEVADTSLEQDLGRKLRDYAAAGIPNYWVVDVNARVVHAMADPIGEEYRIREVIRHGEPLAIPELSREIVID